MNVAHCKDESSSYILFIGISAWEILFTKVIKWDWKGFCYSNIAQSSELFLSYMPTIT